MGLSRIGLVSILIGKSAINRLKKVSINEIQLILGHLTKMPSATITKSAMAGVKRKSAPIKNSLVKETKKLKIDSKSSVKTKSKTKSVKKVETPSDSDSDSLDLDEDGGVPLTSYEEDEEVGEESDAEDIPKVADGLHPDRAKAVSTNCEYLPFSPSTVN